MDSNDYVQNYNNSFAAVHVPFNNTAEESKTNPNSYKAQYQNTAANANGHFVYPNEYVHSTYGAVQVPVTNTAVKLEELNQTPYPSTDTNENAPFVFPGSNKWKNLNAGIDTSVVVPNSANNCCQVHRLVGYPQPPNKDAVAKPMLPVDISKKSIHSYKYNNITQMKKHSGRHPPEGKSTVSKNPTNNDHSLKNNCNIDQNEVSKKSSKLSLLKKLLHSNKNRGNGHGTHTSTRHLGSRNKQQYTKKNMEKKVQRGKSPLSLQSKSQIQSKSQSPTQYQSNKNALPTDLISIEDVPYDESDSTPHPCSSDNPNNIHNKITTTAQNENSSHSSNENNSITSNKTANASQKHINSNTKTNNDRLVTSNGQQSNATSNTSNYSSSYTNDVNQTVDNQKFKSHQISQSNRLTVKEIIVYALRCEMNGFIMEALSLYEECIRRLRKKLYSSKAAATVNTVQLEKRREMEHYLQNYESHAKRLRWKIQKHLFDSKLIETINIAENSRGNCYDNLFAKYLNENVTEAHIVEPNMCEENHYKNLICFLELLVKRCPNLCYIRLNTQKDMKSKNQQRENLEMIGRQTEKMNVAFNFRFENGLIDHKIILSNGIIIDSALGLHYIKPCENQFALGLYDYDYRTCWKCKIDIWSTGPFSNNSNNQLPTQPAELPMATDYFQ